MDKAEKLFEKIGENKTKKKETFGTKVVTGLGTLYGAARGYLGAEAFAQEEIIGDRFRRKNIKKFETTEYIRRATRLRNAALLSRKKADIFTFKALGAGAVVGGGLSYGLKKGLDAYLIKRKAKNMNTK